MKIINMGSTVKWQNTDKRNVPDVRLKIVEEIDFSPGMILEIGCAAGNFYQFLSNFSRYSNYYIGVDIDANQINRAKKKYPTGMFIHGNILHMDELLQDCRTVVSFQVLEHIENDYELFEEIDKGTTMIFSVPNFPYRENHSDGHKRYYEIDGWIKRYEHLVEFSEAWIVKHYKKDRKIFVFQGIRR